jgi:peptidoglycan/LPS O-acetylase OafA/YrhL
MSTEIRKYDYIDCLRGLAVIGVVAAHTSDAIPSLHTQSPFNLALYCQMGVQLFFVASALTLCLSMRSRGIGDKEKLIGYFVRRYFRIAPLYYIAIIAYFFLSPASQPPIYTWVNIVGNMLFLHGFLPTISNSVVPGGWSIGTEMIFYLIFPVLFITLKTQAKALLALTLYMGVLGYIVLLTRLGFLSDFHVPNNQFLYFNILVQLPVFLSGIVAYHSIQREAVKAPTWLIISGGAAGLLFGICIWHTPWTARHLLSAGLFGITFSALAILLSRLNPNVFLYPPLHVLREIGKKSYAIYLFHFPFVWGMWPKIVPSVPLPPIALLAVGTLISIIPSYIIAWIANRLIEEPGIGLGKRLIDRFTKPNEAIP